MVVLAAAMRPADGVEELAPEAERRLRRVRVPARSRIPKLRPVETNAAGVFICGACQAPKDIPESVAQASAAAGKVQVMFGHEELTREPEIARINEQTCAACFACVRTCPYHAIEQAEIRDRKGDAGQAHGAGQPGPVHGLRHVRGRLPVQERRPGRASASSRSMRWWRAWYEREQRIRAEDRRLRLQLVHVPGRGPGRHQPPGVSGRTCASCGCPAPGGSIST